MYWRNSGVIVNGTVLKGKGQAGGDANDTWPDVWCTEQAGRHHVIHSLDAFDFFSPRLTKCSQPRSPTYFAGFTCFCFFKKKLKINYLKQDGDSLSPILVQISHLAGVGRLSSFSNAPGGSYSLSPAARSCLHPWAHGFFLCLESQ